MNTTTEEMKKKIKGIGTGSKYRKTNNQETEKYARKLYQR